MRHTCQVFVPLPESDNRRAILCEEPAVDFVEIGDPKSGEVTRIWLCAKHWDEHWEKEHAS